MGDFICKEKLIFKTNEVAVAKKGSLYTRGAFFFLPKSNIIKLHQIYLQIAKNVI